MSGYITTKDKKDIKDLIKALKELDAGKNSARIEHLKEKYGL